MGESSTDGSFKIYVEPDHHHASIDIKKEGPASARHESTSSSSSALEMFAGEVENVRQDLIDLEKRYVCLQECNEEIKGAENARTMRDVRTRLNSDLDSLFKLAKQINKKFDGLVRANAAQRRGNSDDHVRASMIAEVVERLQFMMRSFQSLRTQMEADHRQLIEARFYALTGAKATAEAIDSLIANEVTGSPLHHAIQELGRDPVTEAVVEIQERRDAMREIRRNLMALHQVFLGIATPVGPTVQQGEAQVGGNKSGDLTGSVESFPAPLPAGAAFRGGKGGTGGLNDFERETRNQAYVAIVIALIIVTALITAYLQVEIKMEKATS